MEVISFKNALEMYELGYNDSSEKFYVFQVVDQKYEKIIEGKKWYRTEEVWDGNDKTVKLVNQDRLHAVLSDRFYDSWTDKAIPAYNLVELGRYIKAGDKRVDINSDVNEVAELIISMHKSLKISIGMT